ncbi:hypothetical protein [Dictyobacter kobayashii]|uniref:Uncharacterized protein n=1 Tax=Dictyobacter kobayashii TaxID=2014872 RepID=A0A402AFD1_9CHLR|nr:hypothetical protein [Dictyobacter kobayashii]GCE17782.1 hypothetical protein KDK_15820 [Dictyobacter kobayashii]
MVIIQQGCPPLSSSTTYTIRALKQPACYVWQAHTTVAHGDLVGAL